MFPLFPWMGQKGGSLRPALRWRMVYIQPCTNFLDLSQESPIIPTSPTISATKSTLVPSTSYLPIPPRRHRHPSVLIHHPHRYLTTIKPPPPASSLMKTIHPPRRGRPQDQIIPENGTKEWKCRRPHPHQQRRCMCVYLTIEFRNLSCGAFGPLHMG